MILGRVSDVHGRKAAVVASAALGLVGYLCFVPGLTAGAPVLLPCLAKILTTVGRAALMPPLNALVTDGEADEASRRRVGNLVGSFGLGYATGSGLGGYLSQHSTAAPLGLACACAATEVVCAVLLPPTAAAARTDRASGMDAQTAPAPPPSSIASPDLEREEAARPAARAQTQRQQPEWPGRGAGSAAHRRPEDGCKKIPHLVVCGGLPCVLPLCGGQ